jgi:hypothetical protein
VAAESAFLHHPFRSDGDISIKRAFQLLWPFGWIPVKVFDGVGAGGGAVAATNASVIDLSHKPFFIDVSGIDRTDFSAGGIVAMHARAWKKPRFNMRIFSLNIRYEFDPVNRSALSRLLWPDNRYVVLGLAGNHASLAGRAFV